MFGENRTGVCIRFGRFMALSVVVMSVTLAAYHGVAWGQHRRNAGRHVNSRAADAAAPPVMLLATLGDPVDAGPPNPSAPAAEWNGTICVGRDDSGALSVTIDYAAFLSPLECDVAVVGADALVHAFWWGVVPSGQSVVANRTTHCTVGNRIAGLRSIRIDDSATVLNVEYARSCWHWPSGASAPMPNSR